MTSLTANIAGISFALKDNPELKFKKIEEGSSLDIFLEPENEYDPKAIRLEYNGEKLGYVPRKSEDLDFSIQSWCYDNFDKVSCEVDQIWYIQDSEITFEYSDGCEIVGIAVKFKIPEDISDAGDLIITKTSLSEPDIIVDFNDTKHIYNMRAEDGYKVLRGGTTFIKRFYKPFDSGFISKICAKSWGVPEEKIKEMWESNGKLAGDFGTVVHYALEHYINYSVIGAQITKIRRKKDETITENYAMPKHPFLKKVIKSLGAITNKLDKKYRVEEVIAEALVTDSATGWGGLVDRLAVIDRKKKIARIQDYKVNINASENDSNSKPLPPFSHLPPNKLTKYALQLSFYAALLQKHGWKIEGLDVFVFEDKWVHYELDLIDYSILKKKKK